MIGRSYLFRVFAENKSRFLIVGAAAILCVGAAVLWVNTRATIAENLKVYGDTAAFENSLFEKKPLFLDNEEDTIAAFEDSLALGMKAIDNVTGSAAFDDDRKRAEELKATLIAADALFQERVKLGLTPDVGLVGSMRGNAMLLEIALLERQQWRAAMELLYMRRYENEFLERFADASVTEHRKYGNLLEQEIAQATIKKSDKESVTEIIKAYRNDFNAVAETIRNIIALTREYKEKSARAQVVLTEFGNAMAQKNIERERNYILPILFAMGFAAVLALAAFFARAVYYPIRKMGLYMESLAAGDTKAEVPFKNYAGEIGKMAEAIAVFKDSLLLQKTMNQNRAAYEQETNEYLDKIVASAEELSSNGQEIKRCAGEVLDVSLSVSEEMAEANSLMLKLAERVDAVDGTLRQIGANSQPQEAAERMKRQLAEIREGINKAVSKILFINDVIMKVRGISKEMVLSAEGQGPATRGVVRGIRYVSSLTQDRMVGNDRP